jgi:hypothetical protein
LGTVGNETNHGHHHHHNNNNNTTTKTKTRTMDDGKRDEGPFARD